MKVERSQVEDNLVLIIAQQATKPVYYDYLQLDSNRLVHYKFRDCGCVLRGRYIGRKEQILAMAFFSSKCLIKTATTKTKQRSAAAVFSKHRIQKLKYVNHGNCQQPNLPYVCGRHNVSCSCFLILHRRKGMFPHRRMAVQDTELVGALASASASAWEHRLHPDTEFRLPGLRQWQVGEVTIRQSPSV